MRGTCISSQARERNDREPSRLETGIQSSLRHGLLWPAYDVLRIMPWVRHGDSPDQIPATTTTSIEAGVIDISFIAKSE